VADGFTAIAARDPNAAERAAGLHVANARRTFFDQERVSPAAELPGAAASRGPTPG